MIGWGTLNRRRLATSLATCLTGAASIRLSFATRHDRPPFYSELLWQANVCETMGSPFTARVLRLLRQNPLKNQLVRNKLEEIKDPHSGYVPLRITGALHHLVITEKDLNLAELYPPNSQLSDRDLLEGIQNAIDSNPEIFLDYLKSPPQTNEVGRSGFILPCLLQASRDFRLPISLLEIGSSAGLNLQLDHFHYTYGQSAWGDCCSSVDITPNMRGEKLPNLSGNLRIISKRGCDLNPIDITDKEARVRLLSYVWPDQLNRKKNLAGALDIAYNHNREYIVEKESAESWVKKELGRDTPGSTKVLFHTVMWTYLPDNIKKDIENSIKKAGAKTTIHSPLVHITFEEPTGEKDASRYLTMQSWPGVNGRPAGEKVVLAVGCSHGNWIKWR
ncbi:hypothetical protein AAMO2058_000683000 [Amorphochlora amoebiformis]